eukprot:evm.model.scf_792.1 EVM.evm.TU.scf_792.1   scf_792:10130-15649(-)
MAGAPPHEGPLPDVMSWQGQVEVHKADGLHEDKAKAVQCRGSAVLDNKEGHDPSWSQMMAGKLHSRSTLLTSTSGQDGLFSRHPSSARGGEGSSGGIAQDSEEVLERVRYFAEACDWLQGFQILHDDVSPYGPLATAVLWDLRDQYSGAPITLVGLQPPLGHELTRMQRNRASIKRGMSLGNLAEPCALYIPLGEPSSWPSGLSLSTTPCSSLAHLHAMALTSATLPFRLNPSQAHERGTPLGEPIGATDLQELCKMVSGRGAPLGALSASIPPHFQQRPFAATADSRMGGVDQECISQGSSQADLISLSPGMKAWDATLLAESVVWLGPRCATTLTPMLCDAAAVLLDSGLAQEHRRCVRHRCLFPTPLPTLTHSPGVPTPSQATAGRVLDGVSVGSPGGCHEGWGQTQRDEAIPVLTRLRSTPEFGPMLLNAIKEFEVAARTTWGESELNSWGVEMEDKEQIVDNLRSWACSYDTDIGVDDLDW